MGCPAENKAGGKTTSDYGVGQKWARRKGRLLGATFRMTDTGEAGVRGIRSERRRYDKDVKVLPNSSLAAGDRGTDGELSKIGLETRSFSARRRPATLNPMLIWSLRISSTRHCYQPAPG